MTPHQLLTKIMELQGPCTRFCSYCPENFETAEVKECIEKMYKEIYALQADKDQLLNTILELRKAYRKETGHEYEDRKTDG